MMDSIPMYADVVDFIRSQYPRAKKIVEVGIGPRPDVAQKLHFELPSTEIVVTDWDPSFVRFPPMTGIRGVVDDVFHPRPSNYEGAELIYALRPPGEILTALEALADTVDADLWVSLLPDDVDALRDPRWARVPSSGATLGWIRRKRTAEPSKTLPNTLSARLTRSIRS